MGLPSCYLHTFGCRLNQFDGDALQRLLREAGFSLAEQADQAEVQVINSCTITHEAEQEAKRLSRKLARRYPAAGIVWTGCAASSRSGQALAALPNVRLVVDNEHKMALPDLLRAHHFGAEVNRGNTAPPPLPAGELPVAPSSARSRALLKVQDGCDYRCSFCIVPTVRGSSRSLAVPTLRAQLSELLLAGVPEVVITGVHLGTWGRDLTPRRQLPDLLATLLADIERSKRSCRLRLSSIDPHEWNSAATALYHRYSDLLCRSLHLPTQSLCDATLRRMRRAHRASHFEHAVRHLVAEVPQIGIGSDIIVGFPGETDEHFDETYARLAALPLSYLHVFGYSPRAGTAAADFTDPIPEGTRRRRVGALRALSTQLHKTFVARACGQELEVVVHRSRRAPGAALLGMTDTFIKVQFEGSDALLGKRVRVRLTEPTPSGAWGTWLPRNGATPSGPLAARGRARLVLSA